LSCRRPIPAHAAGNAKGSDCQNDMYNDALTPTRIKADMWRSRLHPATGNCSIAEPDRVIGLYQPISLQSIGKQHFAELNFSWLPAKAQATWKYDR